MGGRLASWSRAAVGKASTLSASPDSHISVPSSRPCTYRRWRQDLGVTGTATHLQDEEALAFPCGKNVANPDSVTLRGLEEIKAPNLGSSSFTETRWPPSKRNYESLVITTSSCLLSRSQTLLSTYLPCFPKKKT